jgi:hypothetical protein
VLASGLLLLLLGGVCIALVPVDLAVRGLLSAGWAFVVGRELCVLRCAYVTFRYISVGHRGTVWLYRQSGVAVAAEILPGSMLLTRVGWLRLRTMDGRRFAELLVGNCRKSKDWRRLQVIWRHL